MSPIPPIIGKARSYEFAIKRATDAKTLHAMRTEIVADSQLWPEEKSELCESIDRRFGQLNLETANFTPRWGETPALNNTTI